MHLSLSDASAQLFSNSGAVLPKTLNSAVNWVDIDMDGDLDMSISGEDYETSGTAQGKLYIFNSSHVIASSIDIRGLSTGDQSWSDFNNDGNPDLLYAGTGSAPSAGIDTFDVSLVYHSKFSGFVPVTIGSVDWGDYDNDGDYDVFICGKDVTGSVIANLYNNRRGVFTNVSSDLPGVVDGKAGFIDYDLDKDLDIFITGMDVNGNKYARLWKNTNGTFSITGDLFLNLRFSQFAWLDINSDGYPDLILSGWDDTTERSKLYINNSGSGFTSSSIQVPKVERGSSCPGDLDNDGDPDLFLSGYKPETGYNNKFVFYNNGTDFMSYDTFISDPVYYSYAQPGDYDNDGDLDFVVNGLKEDGWGNTILIKNSCATTNNKPSVPVNLSAVVEGTSVTLRWDNSTDDKTPQESITYNIYIGTVDNKIKIVSPVADLSTGFRRISRPGYIRDNVWTIKNLPVGTYYWGVQAIDNSLRASAFSVESTFETKDRFTKVTSTETPSQSTPAVFFDCDQDNDLDLFLNNSSTSLKVVENTLVPFSQSNYRAIDPKGYWPITTLTPNDYNNNNLIDFTISGDYDLTTALKRDSTITLYGYTGPFSFSIINDALVKYINFEYVLWADFNNDGKQDFITSGKTTNLGTGNIPVTYIYKNMGNGTFQNVPVSIRGFESTGAVAGDFDNDLDIDILIYGKDLPGSANTYVYSNEGNFIFTETLIPGNELFREYLNYGVQTGDFNRDGQLDIFMAGTSPSNDRYARVLLNNSMNFSDANLQVRSSVLMSNFWADYDYDGDLDIFSTSSYTLPDNKVRLYLNNNGTLTEIVTDLGASHSLNLPFMAVNLDNKNGLDFLMKTEGGAYNQFYDNWGSDDRITSAPGNIQYEQVGLDIILEWDKLPDCPACTYNIRVGTTAGGVDIMSPMADLTTGYRYVVGPGNAYLNNSWKLSDLDVGTYHWSVQAVDPSNTGGPWSTESTFTVSHIDADFSFTTVCLGDSTAFSDLSVATGTINKWKWSFGDGATSTLRNPKHKYASSGTFTTGLWAYSTSGDSAFQSYPVTVKAVPVAGFSTNIACQGTPTTFTNTTDTAGLTITNWLWNFGDSQTSNLRNPETHGYLNPGDYQASLTVVAGNGCSDVITGTVTVAGYPVASVTADAPLTFCKGDSVTLSVPYNNKYTYKWMAGGIGLTGGDTSRYVARLSGDYTVEVVNSTGNCKTTSSPVAITANDAPAAPLIIAQSLTTFCEGDSVVLSVVNTPGNSYQWKLNGGAVGIDSSQYTAKASGTYSLTVSNSTGCKADATNTIDVTANPTPGQPAIDKSGPTTFCDGGSVDLSVTNNPAYTYQWENSGAILSGETTNSYIAQVSGVYSLRITNSSGCYTKTDNVTVSVLALPAAPSISASKSTELCQGDSVELSVTNTLNYTYQWKRDGGLTGISYKYYAKSSGQYSLTVRNAEGCYSEAANTVDVVVREAPAPGNISLSGPATFCQGGSVTLNVPVTTGYTYRWKNEYGEITGAETNSFTSGATGTYRLEVMNSTGCRAETAPVTVTVKPMPDKPVITSTNYSPNVCPGKDPIELSAGSRIPGYKYTWIKDGELRYNDTLTYIEFYEKGIYKLRVKAGECASESEAITITLPDAPEKPVIYVRGPVVWYFAASTKTGDRFQWYRNGEQITGATKFIYVANKTLGTYKVAVGNQNECYTMSDEIKIPVAKSQMTDFFIPREFLAGEDKYLSESIQVYPNPTTGLITIEMENDLLGSLTISIISEQGKEIKNIKTEKRSAHFLEETDLGGQPSGIYFVNIQVNNYLVTRKVIVE